MPVRRILARLSATPSPFGVGAQQQETYPARLQEILRSRGVRAEVLNAGVPGYGLPDEVAWFERWGRPLDPDVILVMVFIGNSCCSRARPTCLS